MPHLTLEYTTNLDEWANDPALLISLHRLLGVGGWNQDRELQEPLAHGGGVGGGRRRRRVGLRSSGR